MDTDTNTNMDKSNDNNGDAYAADSNVNHTNETIIGRIPLEGLTDVDSVEMENEPITDAVKTDGMEAQMEETPPSHVELVTIPFINDGDDNIQLFCNSMFRSDEGCDAVGNAEKYFFNCFTNDDEPKWDGVVVCQYNFTKKEIIRDDRNGIINTRDFKSKWLWSVSGAREDVTFNVKCTMPKVWASHFQSFLKELQRYGQIGHSGQISFMANGDGNFKPKFRFTKEYDSVQGIPATRILKKAEQMFDAG